ncbi:apoptosis regulator BAX-like [Sinocyclocheilus grahami]|uniref:Apoptosis regulator BAX-like n=1 Tax=Sinocyclocheilus grahami TaxID=75366 RepID=A0A672TAV4_SINGR|nr:PREDICTED: apoptosis regulator BAX-like [Sinocyclocheilus grahami]
MKTEKSEALMASDYEFSKNLVLRSVKDQIQRAGTCAPSLPEPQLMSAEREQLLDQVANFTRDIGDIIDRDIKFNNMVDGFARVADTQSFQSLVEKVFVDCITWGKIITLICVIGKTAAKILANSAPDIVFWTLDYFRDYLQNWICNRGGWVNSIYSLARSSFELDFSSSSSPISLSSGVIFLGGALLGGLIVWRLKRGA